MRATIFAMPLLALLCIGAAPEDHCPDDGQRDPCTVRGSAQAAAYFGLKPIEELTRAGIAVRRIYAIDASGRYVAAISFSRSGAGAPMVNVAFPKRDHLAPLEAVVDEARWRAVMERVDPLRDEVHDRVFTTMSDDELCIDPWSYSVEAGDPGKPARRWSGDLCYKPFAAQTGWFVEGEAIAAFPICNLLDPGTNSLVTSRLRWCTRIEGDRRAGVLVSNAAAVVGNPYSPAQRAALPALFAPDAVLAEGAVAALPRGPDAAKRWIELVWGEEDYDYTLLRVRATTPDRVEAIGRFERDTEDKPSVREAAPVTMIWTRAHDDVFLVRQVTVGAFAPVKR